MKSKKHFATFRNRDVNTLQKKLDDLFFLKELGFKIALRFTYKSILRNSIGLLFFLSFQQSYTQTLQQYKEEALQKNPELKAIEFQYKKTAEQINEVGGLTNTDIAIGYFVNEPEIRTGTPKAYFRAQQQFSWFGVVNSKKKVMNSLSEIDRNHVEVIKRKVFLELETYYYELYGLKAKIKILQQQQELLKMYKATALQQVDSSATAAVDLLKLEIAENNFQDQLEILKGEVLTKEAALNQVLHRDGFDPLKIPDNLYIPEEEPTLMIDDITFHPELEKFDFKDILVDHKKEVNNREALPSFGLGLDYIIVEEQSEQVFTTNGKDIVMPTVSFSIPIFTRKHSSKNIQYEFEKEGLAQQREAAQNSLEKLLEAAVNKRITARINYDTQHKNILKTKEVEQLLITQNEAKLSNFKELLEIQRMILDFEYKKIEAIAMYFKQSAILNYLM